MGAAGINVAGRAEYAPSDLAEAGARWVRCVSYPDYDLRPWLLRCKDLGLTPLLVIGSETLGNDEGKWSAGLLAVLDRYGGQGWTFQVGNEPDGMPPSSWVMDAPRYQRLWTLARGILHGERVVTAGFCSGHPEWFRDLDLAGAWALAYHPYGRWPGRQDWRFGDLAPLHAAYKQAAERQGIGRILISEVGVSTDEVSEAEQAEYYGALAAWIAGRADLEAGLLFCWSDQMVRDFGLLRRDGSKKPSYRAFVQGAGGPTPTPPGFDLVATPSALSVEPGSVGKFSVLIRPRGDFAGSVTLTPLGEGVTVRPAATTLSPVAGSYLMADFEASGPKPGPARIEVVGRAGNLSATAEVAVRLLEPPPPPPPPPPRPEPEPVPLPFFVGAGVAAAVRANGWTLFGPEIYPTEWWSLTPTDAGLLVWLKVPGKLVRVPYESLPPAAEEPS